MSIPVFDPGDQVFFDRNFTKATGAPPGIPVNVTVVLAVVNSAGAAVTPAPTVTTNVAAGVATSTASLTVPALNASAGMWYARWTASVDIVAVEEECFFVRTSPVL